jgi:hypothetical protein
MLINDPDAVVVGVGSAQDSAIRKDKGKRPAGVVRACRYQYTEKIFRKIPQKYNRTVRKYP